MVKYCTVYQNSYFVLQEPLIYFAPEPYALLPVIDCDLFATKAGSRRRYFCLVVPQQSRLSQARLGNLR